MEDTINIQKPSTRHPTIKEADLVPGNYYIGMMQDNSHLIGWWDGHNFVINNLEDWGQWLTHTITYTSFTPQMKLNLY